MNPRYLSSGILIGDLLWSVLAMLGAIVLRYGVGLSQVEIRSLAAQVSFLVAAWIIWTLLSLFLALDGFEGGWRLSAVVSHLLLAVSGLMVVLLAGGYLFRNYVSRLSLVYFGLLLFAGFVLIRVGAYLLLRAGSKNGAARRIVIVGRGHLVGELARKIGRHPEMLCRVVGFLSPDDGTEQGELPSAAPSVVSIGSVGVVDLLSKHRVDELLLALPDCSPPELLNLAARCRERGIRVSLVPQLYELYLSRPSLVDLDGLPVVQLVQPGVAGASAWKRALDLSLGALLFLIAMPLLLPTAVVLRLGKGRVFRWELRCGYQGKAFKMLRLNIDRNSHDGSWFERMLRELSLTEAPQLWNVLRGEMSLVGPRPESPERACRYSDWQRQRLIGKPGITGLAQVHGLREHHSSEEKTRFDLQYLLNSSLWTDLSLLLQTIWTLVFRRSQQRAKLAPVLDFAGSEQPSLASDFRPEIVPNAYRSQSGAD
jgi:lipopolysaccharide/colanic/teichoic acid biosynthesis glycosyltransferase